MSNSNSLTFDGQDDYVSIRRDISTDFSIALWIKTTQLGTTIHSHWFDGKGLVDMEVSGVTNDFGTSLLQSKFAFGTGSPDVTIVSTTDINDGNWHFCVATRKSSTGELKLYVDGVLENTGTGRTGALTASNIIKIGSDNNRGFFFDGLDTGHVLREGLLFLVAPCLSTLDCFLTLLLLAGGSRRRSR